jgi:hypothetical protein
MVLMIILLVFALLILLLGFLDIKIPFVSGKQHVRPAKKSSLKTSIKIQENLVKDSIQETLKSTKFLKERINESSF